jgi:hypothetical protein
MITVQPVSAALLLLVIVIGATPVMLLAGGLILPLVGFAVAAAALVLVAEAARPAEVAQLAPLLRRAALIAALPASFMVVQLAPLPAASLGHPMWETTAAALGRSLAPSISIDTGATLLTLTLYVGCAGVALLAAAVGFDRYRAQWVLRALIAANSALAALVIGGAAGLPLPRGAHAAALDGAALGVVLAAAAAMRAFERFEAPYTSPGRSVMPAAVASVLALGLAGAATAMGPPGLWLAAAYGVGLLAAVVAIRRLGLGPQDICGIAAAAIIVLGGVMVAAAGNPPRHPALAFAWSPTDAAARILADAPWAGSGAGTFAALALIYRDADDTGGPSAPTAVAQADVELGSPAVVVALVLAAAAMLFLLGGALRRRRDWFYPAAGASGLLVLVMLAFGNAGMLMAAPAIQASVLLGLALAQSRSRSA